MKRPGGGWSAFATDAAVFRGGGTFKLKADKTENKIPNPEKVPGFGASVFSIVGLPDWQQRGLGVLCPEAPTGEIAERHIATIGTSRIVPTRSGHTVFGNRIFIRDNDYLWCIGDPDAEWVPPETFLK